MTAVLAKTSCSETCKLPGLHTSSRMTTQAWEEEQLRLASLVTLVDDLPAPPTVVGGLDLSFSSDGSHACASLAIVELPSLRLLWELHHVVRVDVPYVPGFLAFREVPAYAALIAAARTRSAATGEPLPQLLLVDGNGRLHARRCGAASHLGVLLDVPTIGVSKTLYAAGGLHDRVVDAVTGPALREYGDYVALRCEGTGEVLGAALRSTHSSKVAASVDAAIPRHVGDVHGSSSAAAPASAAAATCTASSSANCNPVYVSIGHRVSLSTALSVVLTCCKYRVPEPIRIADARGRHMIAEWETRHAAVAVT